MAFTESWVETDPDGSIITVSLLDNFQRASKRQIRERLEGDPANLNLSGVFESSGGGFASAAVVKKGVARTFVDLIANIGTYPLQDGRLFVASDTGRMYHLKGSGAVELAYLPSVGGTVTGDLIVSATASDRQIILTANAGQNRNLIFRTGANNRWNIQASNTAESGGNLGSNLVIARYADAGSLIDIPLQISRASGAMTLGADLTISNTGASKYLILQGDATFEKGVVLRTGTSNRWHIMSNTTAEGGGNAGSNFDIRRYDDSGTLINTPFQITRSSGLITINNGLTISALGLTVSSGGASVSGNSTITGTLTVTSTINGQTISAAASFSGSVATTTTLTVGSSLLVTTTSALQQDVTIGQGGDATTRQLIIRAAPSQVKQIAFQNNTTTVWTIGLQTGSSFRLDRYNGGVFQDSPIALDSTGLITFNKGATFVTATTFNSTAFFLGDCNFTKFGLAQDSTLFVDGDAGFRKAFNLRTGGVLRWRVGSDDVAESGGNAGANFTIDYFTDAGSFGGSAIQISRADGSLLVGTITGTVFNALTGIRISGAATLGQYLRGNGTNIVLGAIQSGDIPTLDSVSVYSSAGQDLSASTLTAILFDSEVEDTNSMHSTGSNTSRLVATLAGRYLITAHVSLVGVAANAFIVLRKNGVATNLARSDLNVSNTSVGMLEFTKTLVLSASDYVEVYVQTDNAGNDVLGGQDRTYFQMFRVAHS